MTDHTDTQRAWYRRLGFWKWGGILACFWVMAVGVGVWGAIYYLSRPTFFGFKEIEIRKGMSVQQIGDVLYAEGVIRSPRVLALFARFNGTHRRLMAGVHPFDGRMTTWQVLLELEQPRDVTRDVTIPEGLRKEQVARILSSELHLDGDRLLVLMSDTEFCYRLGVPVGDLEGYLFPETYKISTSADEESVLSLLVAHFFNAFDVRLRAQAQVLGMSMHEVVTMASIIEGEARVDAERSVISAVYHNRLKRNMRLQADPTVQYALPDGPRRLFYKDYSFDSPYNTYRHGGLPPGPIMNPGRASLVAAVFPADVDYLFFVARGDGSHVFSRTEQEHEAAKRLTMSDRLRSWRSAN